MVALRRTWSGPFDAAQGVTLDEVERHARTSALDAHLLPLEAGLAELPELRATPEGASRLRHGNPGMVVPGQAEYGDEAWASLDGRALAVGRFKAGDLHPDRVFNP